MKRRQPIVTWQGLVFGFALGCFVTALAAYVLFRYDAQQLAALPTVASLPTDTAPPTLPVTPSITPSETPRPTSTETPEPPTKTPLPTLTPTAEPMTFTGTGDRVFDPFDMPDGVYRVTLRGSDAVSMDFTDLAGSCGYYFGYTTSSEREDVDVVTFRDCRLVISITALSSWEVMFELLS